jgi:hypothetical protein
LSDEVEKLKIIVGNIPEVIIYKKNSVTELIPRDGHAMTYGDYF